MLSSIAALGSAATIASLVALLLAAPEVRAAEGERAALLARGWAALRAMDCARCHGREYDGWAAPSLIASVRETTCERFGRLVLDGNVERGMPPYRTQPVVVAELDAIYAYLLARAQGEIGPGNPSAAQSISPAR